MRPKEIAGLRVLQAGGNPIRGGGNLLLLDETPGQEALLKVYRRRGTRVREASKWLSYRLLERKRGVTARERCALERRQLALWRDLGFDVPALLDRPLPAGFSVATAQWIEYCPGRLLYELARDPDVALATREREVERFAVGLSRRQQRARAADLRDLVMKHASIKHVLLYGDRQVSFDLEGGYARSYPLLGALADELAANLRSLLRVAPPNDRERLGAAFLAGYGRPEQLAEIADFALRRGGVARAMRRSSDRTRRPRFSKHDTLSWVEEELRRA